MNVTKQNPQISVLVPLHDEQDNVALLHQILSSTLAPLDLAYELLFVNDGSQDGTGSALQQLARDDEHAVVIEHPTRRGKAAAIETALERSNGDLLLIIDGDLQYDPSDFPALLDALQGGGDVVSGCRSERNDPLVRRIASKAYNGLVNQLAGTRFSDHFSGIKGFRAEALQRMNLEGGLIRFPLVVAARSGLVVREVPVSHQAREAGASSYSLYRLSCLAWNDLTALLPFLLRSR
jgi:glycosyltransferase involved in cell wall biosynthesis